MINKLLVLTSGGDSPGMNAAIRAVVRSGYYYGMNVFACHHGYQGLINEEIFSVGVADVANCIQRGGTILRTSRAPTFHHKKTRNQCRAFLKRNGIDAVVVIGGDGTFRGAFLLEEEGGPPVIGIPASIDNDITGTEYTIGYDTARNTALHAIDNIRDTASSHDRYFLVETMGRKSGFLAADVAIAGGAEFVITPEFPLSLKTLAQKINTPKRKKQSLIIVVAEAGKPGRSIKLADALAKLTPFQYRVCILGHTQRGGSPTLMDRLTGSTMGNLAVESLRQKKSNSMTSLYHGHYVLKPFPHPDQPSCRLFDQNFARLTDILSI